MVHFSKEPESKVFVMNDLITLARGITGSPMIRNGHMPARISNKPCLLQDAGRHSHCGAARTEHHGQKFLGDCYSIASYPVVAHQKPASQTLLQLVNAITSGSLRSLSKQSLNTFLQAQT